MRMLDIAHPVALADIYTDVNILEQISSQRWKEIPDLLVDFNQQQSRFDRFGIGKIQNRISGQKAVLQYPKLMILGKPGAGKTTFLQWIAVKCNLGELMPNHVPVFLRLKNFAEESKNYRNRFDLLEYLKEYFESCGLNDNSILTEVLTEGRVVLLLDGLDEVSKEHDEIVEQIRKFVKRFFKNKYIITCRIATQKYRLQQENFTDVEIADFNQKQVETFVKKWFLAFSRNDEREGVSQAENFIQQLGYPENRQICELAVTPILLNLACLIFHGTGSFPSKRIRLYESGLNILLVRWDEERGIKRDSTYQNLLLEDKLKMLSQVAAFTFEKERYFFEKDEIVELISDYLRSSLPSNIKDNSMNMKNESSAVLKSIEVQHGLLVERAREVYSFSHLTFQEYFTARKLFDSAINSEVNTFGKLIVNITKDSWNEVWQLLGEMNWSHDAIQGFQYHMEIIENSCIKLQDFLCWVSEKADSVTAPYKPVAIRSFYFSLFGTHREWHLRRLSIHLAGQLDQTLKKQINSDDILAIDLAIDRAFTLSTPDYRTVSKLNPELSNALQHKAGKNLKVALVQYRNIGHDWQFTTQQANNFQKYCNTILVMLRYLNTSSEISPEAKQDVERNLFLPLNKWKNSPKV